MQNLEDHNNSEVGMTPGHDSDPEETMDSKENTDLKENTDPRENTDLKEDMDPRENMDPGENTDPGDNTGSEENADLPEKRDPEDGADPETGMDNTGVPNDGTETENEAGPVNNAAPENHPEPDGGAEGTGQEPQNTDPSDADSVNTQPDDAVPGSTAEEEEFDEDQYLKDLREKRIRSRRRREKQMRALWFILFMTIVLSVTTIIYVETRLSGVISGREKENAAQKGVSAVSEEVQSEDGGDAERGQGSGRNTGVLMGGRASQDEAGDSSASSAASADAAETKSVSKASSSASEDLSAGSETPEEDPDEKDGSEGTDAEEADAEEADAEKTADAEGSGADAAAAEERPENEVRLTAAGDNLIHQRLYEQAAARSTDGTYDFSYAYDSVASFFEEHDLNWIDVETLVNDQIPPSGYPEFSTPGKDGEALLAAGFNVFSLASNHSYDFGADGITATLDFWSQALPEGTAATGLWTEEGMEDIPVVTTRGGYTVAFLTYVDFTNAEPDENMPARVIYLSETELIERQIRLADELADAVVVSCHWGEEGSHDITDEQRAAARQIAEWGADVIIGDHPHVVQNAEWIPTEDGREVFCVYSLGNFISTQEEPDELVGLIMDVTLRFPEEGAEGGVQVVDPRLIPIVTIYGEEGADSHVIFCRDVTDEEIGQHGVRKEYPEFGREYIENVLRTNVDEAFLDLPAAPEAEDTEEETRAESREERRSPEGESAGSSAEEGTSAGSEEEETSAASTENASSGSGGQTDSSVTGSSDKGTQEKEATRKNA